MKHDKVETCLDDVNPPEVVPTARQIKELVCEEADLSAAVLQCMTDLAIAKEQERVAPKEFAGTAAAKVVMHEAKLVLCKAGQSFASAECYYAQVARSEAKAYAKIKKRKATKDEDEPLPPDKRPVAIKEEPASKTEMTSP